MRVLVIHCTYKYKGGEDTVVEEECKLLKSKGYEVETLLFDNSKHVLLNILFYPFNLFSYCKTKRKLKQYRPELVHIHNLHFTASASVIYAVKSLKIPCVLTLHNFRLLCPSATLFHNGKIFRNSLQAIFPWRAIGNGAYKNSIVLTFWVSVVFKLHQQLGTWEKVDKIISLSDHMKELLISSNYHFNPSQIVVKPNFTILPQRTYNKKENFFLYLGRLTEEKGLPVLLKAFEGKTNLQLKVVGDGPLKEQVEAYAHQHSNIKYLGTIKKPQLFDLIARSTALVFPSIWYEGMPLTIIEAFACGTPVIASNLGAMKNMIRHGYNGLHFDSGDTADLCRKLSMWNEFGEAETSFYSSNARSTYQNLYTPATNFQQLNTVYQTALSE